MRVPIAASIDVELFGVLPSWSSESPCFYLLMRGCAAGFRRLRLQVRGLKIWGSCRILQGCSTESGAITTELR